MKARSSTMEMTICAQAIIRSLTMFGFMLSP